MSDSNRPDPAAAAKRWWRKWIPDVPGPGERARRRSARARLRRAKTPLEIIQEPEALKLVATFEQPRERDRAAVLAGILAFVEEDVSTPVARAIGRVALEADDSPPRMSEPRFRRLLQTEPHDLLDPMRRLLRLADGRANVYDLSRAVLRWGDPVRKRWIYLYHGVVSSYPGAQGAAPADSATERQEPAR